MEKDKIFLHQLLIIAMLIHLMLRRILPVILTLTLFVLYLLTMAPDLTWAHTGADGGDLITAAATGGVAHPSGYPTFLLFAKLFQLLPFGSIAYRTNLMSAVFTALTAWLVYDIVSESPKSPAKGMPAAGLLAACAYGLCPLAWSQAVITEVYGLHIFFVALMIWLLVGRFSESSKPFLNIIIGISLGLAMGNHITTVFMLPAVLFLDTFKYFQADTKNSNFKISINWASLIHRFIGFALGLMVYLSILWRAASGAPVNWGYAVNLQNLWWLVSGALYQNSLFSLPLSDLMSRLGTSSNMLLTQFGIIGLLIGFYHLFGNALPSRLFWMNIWLAIISVIFSLSYATADSYIYLLPFFLVFAIWIGFGAGNIFTIDFVKRKFWISTAVKVLFVVYFCSMAVANYPNINLSDDYTAKEFAQQAIVVLPPKAIVLAEGDKAIFSLWYYHFVQKERPDIAVLANGLLPFRWYQKVLKDTYPALALLSSKASKDMPSLRNSVAQANPDRPVCDVVLDENMSIICYMPANKAQKENIPFITIITPMEKSK